MPKQSKLESTIPALYKRTALNQLMFGYVLGCRAAMQTITIAEAIVMFMEAFKIDHDEFNIDSALVTFNRMQSELMQVCKTV